MLTTITPSNLAFVAVMLSMIALHTGCASDCAKLRKEYLQAVEASPFVEIGEARPVHLGVAVRDELLNAVLDRALRQGLEQGLSITQDIALASGQTVQLQTNGAVADIGLFPDKACDACLRVDGRLDGSLHVKLPILGTQKVPLAGSFSLVAPVRFAAGDEGRAAVVLDLKEVHNIARSTVTPEVSHLPPTWWKALKSPLSKLLGDALLKDLPPVTLFTFEGFDFGVEGLKVVPATIVSDAKHGVVFAGFTTNIAGVGTELGVHTDLGKNDDLAIGATPELLDGLTAALLRAEKVSRTWSTAGDADPAGPIHISAPRVSLSAGSQEIATTFRAWNLPEEGKCAWTDIRASGELASEGDQVRFEVEDVKVTDTSMAGVLDMIATWRASRALRASTDTLSRTISPSTFNLAGEDVTMRQSRVLVEDGAVWLSGRVGGE